MAGHSLGGRLCARRTLSFMNSSNEATPNWQSPRQTRQRQSSRRPAPTAVLGGPRRTPRGPARPWSDWSSAALALGRRIGVGVVRGHDNPGRLRHKHFSLPKARDHARRRARRRRGAAGLPAKVALGVGHLCRKPRRAVRRRVPADCGARDHPPFARPFFLLPGVPRPRRHLPRRVRRRDGAGGDRRDLRRVPGPRRGGRFGDPRSALKVDALLPIAARVGAAPRAQR
mmetsp:Transcript_24793/g.83331  ORF Transcript_24793/g.83331 Transcript_24793/m.83331 type:complete len:228 (+) Transcript_24793:435-1118(+)